MAIRFLDEEVVKPGVRFLDEEVVVEPVTAPQEVVQEEPGFFAGLKEQITGAERRVPETEALPGLSEIPELNSFSMQSFKTALGTISADTPETIQILQSNFPGIQVRQDEQGNPIIRSSIDGKEYSIKPGLRLRDIGKAGVTAAQFIPAGRAAGVAGRMAGAAATQAGIEGAQQVAGGEFNPGQVVGAGLTEAIIPGVAKAVKGARGLTGQGPITAAQQAVKGAERAGITPLTTDIIPPTGLGRGARQIGERIPVAGTASLRTGQQVQRTQAVKDALYKFSGIDFEEVSGKVMNDLLDKRSKDISKYTTAKKEVISRLSARDAGKVDVTNSLFAVEKQIRKIRSLKSDEFLPIINKLDNFKTSIKKQSLSNVEELRRQLGDSFKDPSLASIKGKGEKVAREIYDTLNEDMGSFIKETGNPGDFTKWKVSNKRLADMLGEVKVASLKSLLKKGDATPEQIRSLMFSTDKSKVKLLFKNLSPEGRAQAKVAVMQQVLEKAGGIEDVTPKTFLKQLKKMETPTGVFFNSEDKKVMNGLIKALKLTERAEKSIGSTTREELVSVGLPAAVALIGGVGPGLKTAGATGAALGTIGGLARLYESRPVRNLLLKLASAPAGKEQIILNKLTPLLQAQRQLGESQ